MLLATYALAFADRQLLALFIEPIRHELALDDTALALVHGYGFAVLYAVGALVFGALADRLPRMRLLACAVLLWSAATALSGLAVGLTSLAAGRLALGLSQAAVTPVAYSILGDVHPRGRTGIATAGFAIGPFLGIGLMMILAGPSSTQLDAHAPEFASWRLVFGAAGLIGLPLGLALLLVREPARPGISKLHGPGFLSFASSHGLAMVPLYLAMAFAIMAVQALLAWGVSWQMRSHEVELAVASTQFGTMILLCGGGGTLLGGVLGDFWCRHRPGSSRLPLLGLAALLGAPLAVFAFRTPDQGYAMAALSGLMLLCGVALANGSAAIQDVVPAQYRGAAHGIAVLVTNLLGLGLGPLIIGVGSDWTGSLGTAFAWTLPVMLLLAALCAFGGARRLAAIAA